MGFWGTKTGARRGPHGEVWRPFYFFFQNVEGGGRGWHGKILLLNNIWRCCEKWIEGHNHPVCSEDNLTLMSGP